MFTGNEGTFITLAEGAQMTKAYRDNFLNSGRTRKAVFFGKNKLLQLLNQSDDCVGARFYFAAKESESGIYELDLVVVGARANETDIITAEAKILDDSSPCPTQCDTASPLFGTASAETPTVNQG
ncbi:MAG TPA: hypothetical protein VEC12_00700 [Bacteroidia bacterium]|nr:hypothetical protein [Bacteroidia bacterium]